MLMSIGWVLRIMMFPLMVGFSFIVTRRMFSLYWLIKTWIFFKRCFYMWWNVLLRLLRPQTAVVYWCLHTTHWHDVRYQFCSQCCWWVWRGINRYAYTLLKVNVEAADIILKETNRASFELSQYICDQTILWGVLSAVEVIICRLSLMKISCLMTSLLKLDSVAVVIFLQMYSWNA